MSEPQTKIPVITCFDIEPDTHTTHRNGHDLWLGFEHMHVFLSKLRPHLGQLTKAPVHYGWYFRLDPQIDEIYGSHAWPLRKYSRFVSEYSAHGDEIGINLRAYQWNSKTNRWVPIHDDPAFINSCIEMSFEAYESYFMKRCHSIRMDAEWLSAESIECAEKLGAKYGLTLEPDQLSRGPLQPYLPWKLDYHIPDKNRSEGLWLIPLTSEKIGGLRKLLRGNWRDPEYMTLDFAMSPRLFRSMVDEQINAQNHPYLAIASSVRMASMKRTYDQMCVNFKYLLSFPHAKRIRFITPDEAMRILGLKRTESMLRQAAS